MLDIDGPDWATKVQADIISRLKAAPARTPGDTHPVRKDAKMHAVELLEQAIALADRLGWAVRQDWFGGSHAGTCELKGRRFIFIDLATSPREQLDQVLEALRSLPNLDQTAVPAPLQALLGLRKAG